MQYDIFISYTRRDNQQGQVDRLVDRISLEFKKFSGRPLNPFFDTREIDGGEYWQDKILKGLKESRLMLACLSPEYLKSQWCEWEFIEYQKYELGRAFLGQGVAPIYFVQVPGFETGGFEETCARWVAELRKRQHHDLRPWYLQGEAALQQAEVAARLENVTKQVWEQIRLGDVTENRKGNLDRANERFVGRVQEMQRLHKMVGLGRVGVLTAVHGLGGIGKTALALQYAHAYGDAYAGGCWQIRCEGKADLMEAFASLHNQRDMVFELTDDEKKSLERQFERVLRELKKRADAAKEAGHAGKVLILLDNVDKPELLEEAQTCRLPQADWLSLLATTRLGAEDLEDLEEEAFLSVDELPEADALALIESYQPKRTFKDAQQRDAALKIVRLLGGMPLAVEVAAVYMGSNKIGCDAFLARLETDGHDYFATVERTKKGTIRHGEKCLAITLQPTLERLSPRERLALDYAALLPADHIPLPWLRALVAREFPDCGQDARVGDVDPWLEVVRRLLSLRLLQATDVVDKNGLPLVTRMHRLVGEVLRQGQPGEHSAQRHEALVALTKDRTDFLEDHWADWANRWEMPPLVALARHWMERLMTDGAILANNIFKSRCILSFVEAHHLLTTALDIDTKAYEPTEPALATSYSNLALVERDLGNLTEARRFNLLAIDIRKQLLPPLHFDLATSYSNLAIVERDLGNLTEARRLLLLALDIETKAFEPTHPALAISYSNLALVERDLGNLTEARRLMLLALDINITAYEPTHPTLAISYSNLALVEQDLGNLTEARRLLLLALDIQTTAYEPTHPTLATTYSNLAMVEQALGNFTEARRLLLLALDIQTKAFEPTHPVLAIRYSNLALVEQDLGNFTEARRLLLLALDIETKAYEPSHPILASTYSLLGRVEYNLGNFTEARRLMLLALDIETKAYEPTHPTLAVRYSNLALVEQDLGNFTEARRLMLLALDINTKAYEPTHPKLAIVYRDLADVCIALKDFAAAQEAVAALEALLLETPAENPTEAGHVSLRELKIHQLRGRIAAGQQRFQDAVASLAAGRDAADAAVAAGQAEAQVWADALQYHLAKALLDGRLDGAAPAIEAAITRNRSRLAANADDTVAASFLARSLLLKARVLLADGAALEALPLASEARELLTPLAEKEWARREDLAECLTLLADAHVALGQPAEAAPLEQEAAVLRMAVE